MSVEDKISIEDSDLPEKEKHYRKFFDMLVD
jgi:hypothetical protein